MSLLVCSLVSARQVAHEGSVWMSLLPYFGAGLLLAYRFASSRALQLLVHRTTLSIHQQARLLAASGIFISVTALLSIVADAI